MGDKVVLVIALGILAAYAVEGWHLRRWLKRERKEDWRDWQEATGWREVAMEWIVMFAAMALAAYTIGR